MVFFRMIDDNVVNIVEVNILLQVLDKLMAELAVDCIDQNCFLFPEQVAVVTGAPGGLVLGTVKIPDLPVSLANPVNIVFDMNGHCVTFSWRIYQTLHLLWQALCQLLIY